MSSITRRIFSFKLVGLIIAVPTLYLFTSFIINGGKELKIGKKAPLFEQKMDGVDNVKHSLSDLSKENGLIVVFSCNTCPFVVGGESFEGWEKQYNDLSVNASKKNIGFVLINSNEAKRNGDDSMSEMIKHAETANYSMKYLMDKNSELADAFGAKTTPHVFVFDAEQKLIYRGSIDNTWDSSRTETENYLNEVINSIDGGVKIKVNDTPPRGCSIKRVK